MHREASGPENTTGPTPDPTPSPLLRALLLAALMGPPAPPEGTGRPACNPAETSATIAPPWDAIAGPRPPSASDDRGRRPRRHGVHV